jgi:hypothetical protein
MPAFCCRRAGTLLLLVSTALAVPACSNSSPQLPAVTMGQRVHGKVTYEGEPVPYGYVIFYSHGLSLDPKTGGFVPMAHGEIKDGQFDMPDVPTGPVMVTVATDPDADPMTFLLPVAPPGAIIKGGPGDPKGGPPIDPKTGQPIDPKGGPPGAPRPPNPFTQKLTAEQKQTLKAIHAKYGQIGKSDLNYSVKEGDQTFDLILTK